MKTSIHPFIVLAAACLAVPALAQTLPLTRPQPALKAHPEWPTADPADTATV